MYPHQQHPKPEPSFLEREIGGCPIWGHLLIGVATFGIYFLFLPFILLFDAIGNAFSRRVDRVVESIFTVIWRLVKLPFRLLYRWLSRP